MADVWTDLLFRATFNHIPLDIEFTEDEFGRALVSHEYPFQDGADVDDMGGIPRTTRCRIFFFEKRGESVDHLQRLIFFLDQVASGQAAEFLHPLFGSYQAKVGECRTRAGAEERGMVVLECTFHRDGVGPNAIDNLNFAPDLVGAAVTIEEQAAAASALLDAAELASTTPADVAAAVARWESDPEMSIREVNAELSRLSDTIAKEVDAFDMARDLRRYELWATYQRLHYNLRKAASSFRQTRDQVKVVTVQVAQPLWVIVTRMYGARQAADRRAEVMRENDIRDPSLIPAGTQLRMRSPAPTGRQVSRGA